MSAKQQFFRFHLIFSIVFDYKEVAYYSATMFTIAYEAWF